MIRGATCCASSCFCNPPKPFFYEQLFDRCDKMKWQVRYLAMAGAKKNYRTRDMDKSHGNASVCCTFNLLRCFKLGFGSENCK